MAHPLPDAADDLTQALAGQPELFSRLEVDPETINAAKAISEHNGNTTLKHHQDAGAIIAALMLGWSDRKIARDLQHGEKTVRAIRRHLSESGKLTAVKEIALDAAGQSLLADIELGNELLEDIRTEGNKDARAKLLAAYSSLRRAEGVRAGILADKGGGPRGPVVQVNVSGGSVIQVVEEYHSKLASLPSIDSASSVSRPNGPQIGVGVSVDVGADVGGGAGSCPPASAVPGLAIDLAPRSERGAGGVGFVDDAVEDDGNE